VTSRDAFARMLLNLSGERVWASDLERGLVVEKLLEILDTEQEKYAKWERRRARGEKR